MKKGFTLIELLVVIAVIGLLSSVVFASLSNARDKAIVTKTKAESKEVLKAIELSRLSNDSLPINTDLSKSIKDVPEVNDEILNYISEIPNINNSITNILDSEMYYVSDGEWASYEYDDSTTMYMKCGSPSEGDIYPDQFVTYFIAPSNDEYLNKNFSKVYRGWDSYGSPDEWLENLIIDSQVWGYEQDIIDVGGPEAAILEWVWPGPEWSTYSCTPPGEDQIPTICGAAFYCSK